jgi:lysophospholipase L1-like esterase
MKLRRLFIAIFLFSVFINGCSKREIRNIDSKGNTIICLGNSLTSGVGASSGNDYPALLTKQLSLQVINAGLPGDTTSGALKRIKSDVLDKNPFLVIVELGGNDFLHKMPRDETYQNLDKIIKTIQEYGAMVAIMEIRAGFIMKDYARLFRKLAKANKAILIPDLLGGILTNPQLKYDYMHPNDEGYKFMTDKIVKAIKPLIDKNRLLNFKR